MHWCPMNRLNREDSAYTRPMHINPSNTTEIDCRLSQVQRVTCILICFLRRQSLFWKRSFVFYADRKTLNRMNESEAAAKLVQESSMPRLQTSRIWPGTWTTWALSSKPNLTNMAMWSNAIASSRQALGRKPEGHPDRPGYMNNLVVYLVARSKVTGAVADLNGAIDTAQRAVDGTPSNHPNRSLHLNSLAGGLQDRFAQAGEMADLDKSMATAERAIAVMPPNDPSQCLYLITLGHALGTRALQNRDLADLEKAIQLSRSSCNSH